MRYARLAALAAALCHAPAMAADERPAHDPAIEAAAIAILQKKLPDIRKSHDIGEEPVIVRREPPQATLQGISALIDLDSARAFPGRIIWL
ncbi:hypothetical protein [Shinella oryzae]|uniref:Uncharacterized protein n=1 Tax=Shinella oryzae TaxID=2871820 RepID=A0ABY9K7F3_9HYPH|nr:hypothetical protein [Shinella oryzae]WLS04510.1 hypothetical protein Q9315_07855 [Shinella oryzae]